MLPEEAVRAFPGGQSGVWEAACSAVGGTAGRADRCGLHAQIDVVARDQGDTGHVPMVQAKSYYVNRLYGITIAGHSS